MKRLPLLFVLKIGLPVVGLWLFGVCIYENVMEQKAGTTEFLLKNTKIDYQPSGETFGEFLDRIEGLLRNAEPGLERFAFVTKGNVDLAATRRAGESQSAAHPRLAIDIIEENLLYYSDYYGGAMMSSSAPTSYHFSRGSVQESIPRISFRGGRAVVEPTHLDGSVWQAPTRRLYTYLSRLFGVRGP